MFTVHSIPCIFASDEDINANFGSRKSSFYITNCSKMSPQLNWHSALCLFSNVIGCARA